MRHRDEPIPADLLSYLRKHIQGFKQETDQIQMELARMFLQGAKGTRQHSHFNGAMSFHYTELERSFGRKWFKQINGRLNFFRTTENWSKVKGFTRGYWFTDPVADCRQRYMRMRWRKETKLLIKSDISMRTIPATVASKDADDKTTTAWAHIRDKNKVRVNLESLNALRRWLEWKEKEIQSGQSTRDLLSPPPTLDIIRRLQEATGAVIRMARSELASGYIIQTYTEATSGRIYGKGINLQNTPALIKQAALAGLWEYDFSNCHYNIVQQMAARFGYECTAIAHYLAHKKPVREQIAAAAGISVQDAKECLLAIMFGARLSEWHENAIPEQIGVEAARKLYKVDLFQAIAEDIRQAGQVILKGWKRNQRGGLVNDFGKTLPVEGSNQRQQLAHLTQGAEAKALNIATKLYPDDIVLMQHDGFVSTANLNDLVITDAISDATGYRLELETKTRIQIDPDAYFLKTQSKTM